MQCLYIVYSYAIKQPRTDKIKHAGVGAELDFVTSVIAPVSIAPSLFRPSRHRRDFVKLLEFPGEHATSKSRSNLT